MTNIEISGTGLDLRLNFLPLGMFKSFPLFLWEKSGMAYKDLLLDVRWQKKRFEIFTRDNWTCQKCGADRNAMCVHHLCYRGYIDPWEYENEELITFCMDCHKNEHRYLDYTEQAEKILMRKFTMKDSLILDRLAVQYGV